MRPLLLATPLLLALGFAPARAAEPPQQCPAIRVAPIVLPHMKATLRQNREVMVVALGSSSTEGVHATDIAHSYPALLQAQLNAALPAAHIAVLNRGIGGQDVVEMLPRIERDALGVRPTLVIWQVGANGAMKHMPADLFKRLVTNGIQRMQDAHVEVILMNNQRSAAILASPDGVKIDQAMADVAVATGTALFDRGALMDQWRAAGHPYREFMSEDGVHHNDYGYRCVTEALAQAMLDGLGNTPANRAVADRSPK